MVRRKPIERVKPTSKGKPRGKPFIKGHRKTKAHDEILDTSGSESGIRGGVIRDDEQKRQEEPKNEPEEVIIQKADDHFEVMEDEIKEIENNLDGLVKIQGTGNQEIDSIVFNNGPNTLTIRFSKKANRMFRVQIFLNDDLEIRPVTYTGANTGYSFWNLLKGSLKK